MPSQLLVTTVLVVVQWLSMVLGTWLFQIMEPTSTVPQWIEIHSIFAGNLQIIAVLWSYQTINKYIKF